MCVIISTNCIINYFTTFFRWHFTFENITNYFIFIIFYTKYYFIIF